MNTRVPNLYTNILYLRAAYVARLVNPNTFGFPPIMPMLGFVRHWHNNAHKNIEYSVIRIYTPPDPYFVVYLVRLL